MSIDNLREQLAEIDRELLRLVGQRQRLALEIGAKKRETGTPTRDYRQEREVVERARRVADGLGIGEDLAERLVLMLIRSSLALQERDRVSANAGGSGKRALVIGGAGRMGRWFDRFLASQGYGVEVADPAGEVGGFAHHQDWRSTKLDHDLIVVAAPLRPSNAILTELAERRPPGLVFDIGSLKTPLIPGLTALVDAGVRVTSVHPMFGPDTDLLSGRHVIFVNLGKNNEPDSAIDQARELFAQTMAVRIDMDLDRHDRLIAWVLGLSHAVNIAFFSALADSAEDASTLAELSSTTFDHQMAIAHNLAEENPHLYFEIQALNSHGDASLDSIVASVERLRSVIREGDESSFVEMMQRGRDYLGALRAENARD